MSQTKAQLLDSAYESTVLTGSTNNTVTTVTGAKNIQGEANLTYDGSHLSIATDASAEGLKITSTGNTYNEISFDADRTSAGTHLGRIISNWDGNTVSYISMDAGDDTTNKDDGIIRFHTSASGGNNLERLRIDSSGRLLAGTTTPGDSGADDLTIATSGGTGITIRSGDTSNGSIYFSDGTSGAPQYAGFIQYNHGSDNKMYFGAGSSTRFQVESNGNVKVNDGDLVIGTAGHGIDFSATSGTGTSELLSDYEEGTWTPAADTGTVSATYANYIKIGAMVTVFFDLHNFSNTSSSNHILISGLPFAPVYPGESTGAVHGERVDAVTIVAWIDPSPQKIGFRQGVGSSNYSYITHSNINDGTDCNLKSVMTYRTAS